MLEQLKQERNNLILIILLILSYSFNILNSDENTINLSGHSHNDYYQERPLFSALENYMKSIEIDIFYDNETFFVAHSKDEIKQNNTIDNLYLNPLLEIINQNNGYIYPNQTSVFYIFIDIKENGKFVIPKLNQKISSFYKKIKELDKLKLLVKFVVTGDNDYQSVIKTEGVLSIDGKPEDILSLLESNKNNELNNQINNILMPVISDNIRNWTKANNINEVTLDEIEKLRTFIKNVHLEGKLVRFWGYKDEKKIWELMTSLEVDLVNNDNPKQFRNYVSSIKNK